MEHSEKLANITINTITTSEPLTLFKGTDYVLQR